MALKAQVKCLTRRVVSQRMIAGFEERMAYQQELA